MRLCFSLTWPFPRINKQSALRKLSYISKLHCSQKRFKKGPFFCNVKQESSAPLKIYNFFRRWLSNMNLVVPASAALELKQSMNTPMSIDSKVISPKRFTCKFSWAHNKVWRNNWQHYVIQLVNIITKKSFAQWNAKSKTSLRDVSLTVRKNAKNILFAEAITGVGAFANIHRYFFQPYSGSLNCLVTPGWRFPLLSCWISQFRLFGFKKTKFFSAFLSRL